MALAVSQYARQIKDAGICAVKGLRSREGIISQSRGQMHRKGRAVDGSTCWQQQRQLIRMCAQAAGLASREQGRWQAGPPVATRSGHADGQGKPEPIAPRSAIAAAQRPSKGLHWGAGRQAGGWLSTWLVPTWQANQRD